MTEAEVFFDWNTKGIEREKRKRNAFLLDCAVILLIGLLAIAVVLVS